jgi:hypothetical protein
LVPDYEDTRKERIQAEFRRAPDLFIKDVAAIRRHIDEINGGEE